MDPQQQQLKQLQDLFTNANDILLITREQPSIDGLSALLALYSIFSGQRNLQGKQKRVVAAVSGRQGTQYTLLPGSDKIVSELGLRDLVIGVNGYVDNAIESVNWYVDRGRLNVVFKSNPAVPMQFDLKNLDPFYAGANFDVVVVLDTATPADLGNAYRQDPGMYSELPVVNISTNAQNSRFGRVNIVDSSVPSVSELAFQLVQILRQPLTADAATLFLAGITDATQNFQNRGTQTDAIVQQLQSHGARQLDMEAVRAQGSNAPLPVIQGAPAPNSGVPFGGQAPQQGLPSQMGQYPYPNMPYGAMPQYPGYPPQPGFPGQMPPAMPGYYPGYPPQGYPNPMAPQYPYPQYDPNQAQQGQSPEDNQTQNQDENYDQSYYIPDAEEVPSIQHDATQHTAYVPTSDVQGFSHVEPSVYMPQNPPDYGYQSQDFAQPDAPDKIDERKDQQKIPDFKNPPKMFEGTGEKR